MQEDGNFVIYCSLDFVPSNSRWNSKTSNLSKGPYYLKLNETGNLAIYDANDSSLWSSNTYGKGISPYKLKMDNDGDLVLSDSNNDKIWSTGTGSKK